MPTLAQQVLIWARNAHTAALAQVHGVSVAGPNEFLLGQPELAAKLFGIPLGSPSALFVEGSSSLALLVLGGRGGPGRV